MLRNFLDVADARDGFIPRPTAETISPYNGLTINELRAQIQAIQPKFKFGKTVTRAALATALPELKDDTSHQMSPEDSAAIIAILQEEGQHALLAQVLGQQLAVTF